MRLLKLVPDNTNIGFVRLRYWAFGLTAILTIAAASLVGLRGLNLGVDFVGGQQITVTFAQPVPIEEVRRTVGALDLGDPGVQEFGNPRTITLTLGELELSDSDLTTIDGGPAGVSCPSWH